jgi:hypothetical protein
MHRTAFYKPTVAVNSFTGSSGKSGADWDHRRHCRARTVNSAAGFSLSSRDFEMPVSTYRIRYDAFSSNLTRRANHRHDVTIEIIAIVTSQARSRMPPAGFCLSRSSCWPHATLIGRRSAQRDTHPRFCVHHAHCRPSYHPSGAPAQRARSTLAGPRERAGPRRGGCRQRRRGLSTF